MKIIVTCETMAYLSGSPLYNFTLAKELSKEHEVSLMSNWAENYLKYDLEDCGVQTISSPEDEYDLAIISQRKDVKAKKRINVVHSEYDCETPILDADYYVAIRPSIKEHLIKEHGIPESKITVIYNGVDLERFKPIEKEKRDYFKVVIPATRDLLRKKMFDYYVSKASKDYQVYIFGKYFGIDIDKDYVYVFDEVYNIEDHIGDADLVAGILLGRVNLEARAMDVRSIIHDPENPDRCEEFYPDRAEFEERHDIKNVVKKILSI